MNQFTHLERLSAPSTRFPNCDSCDFDLVSGYTSAGCCSPVRCFLHGGGVVGNFPLSPPKILTETLKWTAVSCDKSKI